MMMIITSDRVNRLHLLCVIMRVCMRLLESQSVLLYNVVFGLHAEVTVVRTAVCEINPERGEDVKRLRILPPELLRHVKPINHFTLTTLFSLTDAMQELYLHTHTHTFFFYYLGAIINSFKNHRSKGKSFHDLKKKHILT